MRIIYLLAWLLVPALVAGQSRSPRFEDYAVSERHTGQRVVPKLSPGTNAWYFRTRIREASRQKPNFAGHYILAKWGCGAECLSSAIIDAKTGAVYFTDMTTCCYFSGKTAHLPVNFEPIRFRLNSRLFVFTGLLNEAGANGPHYFKFEHGQLIALP